MLAVRLLQSSLRISFKPAWWCMFSQHAFVKKEWYNVHVPSIFDVRVPTLSPCNKTAGQSKYQRVSNRF